VLKDKVGFFMAIPLCLLAHKIQRRRRRRRRRRDRERENNEEEEGKRK
jgi:hypothetical protein